MILEDSAPWVGVAISAATLFYVVAKDRSKATALRLVAAEERVGRIGERVERLDDRVTKVESDLRHVPDKDATNGLQLDISNLRGELGVLTERIKPIAAMAERIQEALVEKVTG